MHKVVFVGQKFVGGNTFAPREVTVTAVTAASVKLYAPSLHPRLRHYTIARTLLDACYFETVEQMAEAYAAKAGA